VRARAPEAVVRLGVGKVEYKAGRLWEERGKFRLDYKSNIVPDVEIRMRAPEGLEGAEPSVPAAPATPPVPKPESAPVLDGGGADGGERVTH
jgi:hypothetical protein